MSGFAGVFHIDGQPVSERQLEQMSAALAYRGPDGCKQWMDKQTGLVFAHFHTMPEDMSGPYQPLVHANQKLVIAADARVDNRADLLAKLSGYLPQQSHPFTSAELILAAYARWGQDCLEALVGDFAFAIWDAGQKTLFLARDPMGVRQVYYAFVEGAFYFSSSIKTILAALPRPATLNENLMKAFLMGTTDMWVCQTMYQEIHRLPPAHCLLVQGANPTPHLYDSFEPRQAYAYKNDEAWLEAFRGLLDEAIRSRLRSATPVALSVSGGLDSSSIAAVAYHLFQSGESFPKIGLYSTIFENTPQADEKIYFDIIAAHCADWPVKRIVSDDLWGLKEFGRDNNFPLEEPDIFPLRSHSLAILRAASAGGCRVVLTGDMGEMNMGIVTYLTPEVLRTIPLKHWPQEMKHFQHHAEMHWSQLLTRAYIRPFIPDSFLKAFHGLRTSGKKKNNRPWLTQDTRNYVKEVCPANSAFYKPPHLDLLSQLVYYHTRRVYDLVRLSALDVISAYANIETRHPFLDRRLVDFLLHIPQHLRSWQGMDRVILRRSMTDMLPDAIRQRRKTHQFSDLAERGLMKERSRIEDLLQNSQLDKLGLLDSQLLHRKLLDFWSGEALPFRYFFQPLYLESWLQASDEQLKGSPVYMPSRGNLGN